MSSETAGDQSSKPVSFKRALVVDDSRSARVSLKRLLEDQGLLVELADCGEAALDLLKHQLVDVIFMDHTMPGMDGLEALTAIKGNPDTATIPVMMYTTKEGEVYVSQARALGAVGVLQKQFQPHELFDMLLELGLVNERRASRVPPADRQQDAAARAAEAETDRALDQQALGISVQALVTRILEDQHLSLRADILKSHRDFAKQVAAEIYTQQRSERPPPPALAEAPPRQRNGTPLTSFLAVCLTAAILVLGVLYWRTLEERNTALQALSAAAASAQAAESAASLAAQGAARSATPSVDLLNTLAWAMNQSKAVAFDELPFDAGRAQQLGGLLRQLAAAGFRGTVLLESHLGQFCLVTDAAGTYQLPEPNLPRLSCTLIGHPMDHSSFATERQSSEFAEFLAADNVPPGIELRIVAHDRMSSVPQVGYPEAAELAGDWNAAAARNHRVELSIIPAQENG